jgi:long-chain fatty acid transport protein
LDTLPDGSLELEDEAMGVGGRIGILLEPTDTLRFGLVYQTPIKLNFHTKPEFDDLGPGLEFLAPLVLNDLDLSMTLPQQVMGSVFFQATDTLDLMANLGWQEWSEFARDIVTVHTAGQRELGTSIDYDDTWHVAIGARYALTPAWKVSAGIAYDSSIADDDARSATLPVDRAWRYAGGVSYDYDQDMNIGLGYEYIDLGKAELDSTRGPLSGTLEGEYETNAIHVINLTFIYTF